MHAYNWNDIPDGLLHGMYDRSEEDHPAVSPQYVLNAAPIGSAEIVKPGREFENRSPFFGDIVFQSRVRMREYERFTRNGNTADRIGQPRDLANLRRDDKKLGFRGDELAQPRTVGDLRRTMCIGRIDGRQVPAKNRGAPDHEYGRERTAPGEGVAAQPLAGIAGRRGGFRSEEN